MTVLTDICIRLKRACCENMIKHNVNKAKIHYLVCGLLTELLFILVKMIISMFCFLQHQ